MQDRRGQPGHHLTGAHSMLYLQLAVQSHHRDGSTAPTDHLGSKGKAFEGIVSKVTQNKSGIQTQGQFPNKVRQRVGRFLLGKFHALCPDMVDGNLKEQGLPTDGHGCELESYAYWDLSLPGPV